MNRFVCYDTPSCHRVPVGHTDFFDFHTQDRLAAFKPDHFMHASPCSPVVTPPARVAYDAVMQQRARFGLSRRART